MRNHDSPAHRSSLLLLCLALLVFGAACKGGSDTASYPNTLDVSGGNARSSSDNNQGGEGGQIIAGIAFDGGSSIDVLEQGEVEISWVPFTELELALDFGTTPLVVEDELVISVDPTYPLQYEVYTLTNAKPGQLFISNGTIGLGDDAVVTGLDLRPGGSIEFPLNSPDNGFSDDDETGEYVFSNDIQNAGEISIADVDSNKRGRLSLRTASAYVGTGRALVHGRLPGQAGGWLDLSANEALWNAGDLLAYGADADVGNGGAGGLISLYSDESVIENSGDLMAYGGHATNSLGGDGGDGGYVDISSPDAIWNSGGIHITGGDGRDSIPEGRGGRGGRFELTSNRRGDIWNTGDVLAEGGDATNVPTGEGGEITFRADGGEIRSTGALVVRAGDATGEGGPIGPGEGFGSKGGKIDITTENDGSDPDNFPAGDILLSGPMLASGGDGALAGGAGGSIVIFIANTDTRGDAKIGLYGVDSIDGAGGNGTAGGGYGGNLQFDLSSDSDATTGSLAVEPPIDLSGGNADPDLEDSEGGGGGSLIIEAANVSLGSVDVSGGDGFIPGPDGPS